ncbi:MAG: hypothetical protein BWY57_03212 [Betaproteobacteria bacterium ADurb.Bin341]|nr:MAG: hypothetical protein BWY57_03212 [Betaproteobacteria bacterium ADurb.Bin341]
MEIDLNELECRAEAATPGKWTWKQVCSFNTPGCAVFWPDMSKGGVHYRRLDSGGGMLEADANFIATANPAVVLELVRRLRTAESEAVKSERRAIEYGDIVHQFTIAMRAALVAAHLDGLDHGMQWIYNTLAGPGHLPDLDDARALGGAQAMFDAEMAEHKAFRVAHPAPAIQSPKVGDCTEVKPS